MPMTLTELRNTVHILRARKLAANESTKMDPRVTISIPMAQAIIQELEDLIALSDPTPGRDG